MAVHILGAGAVGCLIAFHLSKAGVPTTLLVRSRQALSSLSQLICVESSENLGPKRAAAAVTVEALCEGAAEIETLVVATKAHQALNALQSVSPRLSSGSLVVLMQNGTLGVLEEVKSATELTHRMGCLGVATNTHGCYMRQPFDVVHAGRGEITCAVVPRDMYQTAALCTQNHSALRFERLVSNLSQLSCHARPWSQQLNLLTQKLVTNCCINPLTAILDCLNGDLLGNEHAEFLQLQVCKEAACFLKNEVVLDHEESMAEVKRVELATAKNVSSMLQDVKLGRETEIGYLNGFICRKAVEQNGYAHTNELLMRLVLSKQYLGV